MQVYKSVKNPVWAASEKDVDELVKASKVLVARDFKTWVEVFVREVDARARVDHLGGAAEGLTPVMKTMVHSRPQPGTPWR